MEYPAVIHTEALYTALNTLSALYTLGSLVAEDNSDYFKDRFYHLTNVKIAEDFTKNNLRLTLRHRNPRYNSEPPCLSIKVVLALGLRCKVDHRIP